MKEQRTRELRDFNLNRPAVIRGPFRIISLDIGTDGALSGWLETAGEYGRFYAEVNEVYIKFDRMPFKDLDHFAGVLGKFDPYASCLAEPISIDELIYAALDRIMDRFPQ
jgi:hypothetical protein